MTRVLSFRAALFSKRFPQHSSDRRPGGTVCPAGGSHSARPHPMRGAGGPRFTDREAEAPKKMRDSPKITQEADGRARLPIQGCWTPCPCPPRSTPAQVAASPGSRSLQAQAREACERQGHKQNDLSTPEAGMVWDVSGQLPSGFSDQGSPTCFLGSLAPPPLWCPLSPLTPT